MKNKQNLDQTKIFARFESQDIPFDMILKSKYRYWLALKNSLHSKIIPKQQAQTKRKTQMNGFMVSEALLALLICSISGFLVLASSSALSKAIQMNVQSEMDFEFDLDIEQYDQSS